VSSSTELETLSEHRSFGGVQGYYRHFSTACHAPMQFSVYAPPQASARRVPVLFYLAGLTCTEETFAIKAGAQRVAAELGLMLVAPDTSPRHTGIAGEAADWEFGAGAGFYVDATVAPWSRHWRMFSYVTEELPAIVRARFAAAQAQGIFGHSMGGHGALVCALRRPQLYRSLSALAPICAPSQVPWGRKAFTGYLGADPKAWSGYDAAQLLRTASWPRPLLVDQGLADRFLGEQLRPELLEEAARASGTPLELRRHAGYDHGYFFIATFVEDHVRHHAAQLMGSEHH
jgi:S-formylglutathione hydrolase